MGERKFSVLVVFVVSAGCGWKRDIDSKQPKIRPKYSDVPARRPSVFGDWLRCFVFPLGVHTGFGGRRLRKEANLGVRGEHFEDRVLEKKTYEEVLQSK